MQCRSGQSTEQGKSMSIKIFAVENNAADLRFLQQSLSAYTDLEVTCCKRLEDAVDAFRTSACDMLLLHDSFDAIEEAQRCMPNIPIVVLTDSQNVELCSSFIRSGAQDCLCKAGIDGQQLYRAIHSNHERQKLLTQLRTAANFDRLTGLPNRTALVAEINKRLHTATQAAPFLIMFLDIDDFKLVNDSHGHEIGDAFLVEVARRLKACLHYGDMLASLGGDEFVIVLTDVSEDEEVSVLMQSIERTFGEPIFIDSKELYPTFSAGVAKFLPGYHDDALQLLREADTAMYAAKARGKCRYAWYDGKMRTDAIERLDLERALWRALENNEITIHYQPLVDIETQKPIGFEALARWVHAQIPVSPVTFIPMAERTGLIHSIGLWVLDNACNQLAQWSSFAPDIGISVNVSPVQLERDTFAANVLGVLDKHGLQPNRLTIEVTESGAIKDFEHVAKMLTTLMNAGVRISIDDFGTGHSSLSLLHKLPISEVKVDRSFVSCLEDDLDYSRLFVQTIQMLASGIGLDVVAEGIELETQEKLLLDCGYTVCQGYLYSRPMPASEAGIYLHALLDQTKEVAL
jgi:diguanylate cyclase (GGDEF)-like protein